jgi:hypothetical protein
VYGFSISRKSRKIRDYHEAAGEGHKVAREGKKGCPDCPGDLELADDVRRKVKPDDDVLEQLKKPGLIRRKLPKKALEAGVNDQGYEKSKREKNEQHKSDRDKPRDVSANEKGDNRSEDEGEQDSDHERDEDTPGKAEHPPDRNQRYNKEIHRVGSHRP